MANPSFRTTPIGFWIAGVSSVVALFCLTIVVALTLLPEMFVEQDWLND